MTRGTLDACRAAWWGLADQKTPRPGRRNAAEPSRAHARSDLCRMNSSPAYWRSQTMSRLDSGNRRGEQLAVWRRRPRRACGGHTRQRPDLTALDSGAAQERVTVLSATALLAPRATGPPRPGDTRAFADTWRRARAVALAFARRGKRLASGSVGERDVHEVVIDSSSRGNRPSATTWVGHVRSRRCAWRSCQG